MPLTSVTGVCLAPAKEFEVADSVGHLWVSLASVADGFSCMPRSLSRNEDDHVDEGKFVHVSL